MGIYPDTLYVLKLKTPDHYYVGTTSREWFRRHDEHLEGWGAKWTTKHGVEKVHKLFRITGDIGSQRMENMVVLFYMRHVAKDWRNVKGGDYTWSRPVDINDPCENFWVPEEFGGQRRIDY